MNRVGAVLRIVLVWAMLPLTVLSGTPRSLCLCSNGDVKLFCCGSASASSPCGNVRSNPQRSCCRSGCCRSANKPQHQEPDCDAAKCRCTHFVALPDVPIKAPAVVVPEVGMHYGAPVDEALCHSAATQTVALREDSPPSPSGREVLIVLVRWLA